MHYHHHHRIQRRMRELPRTTLKMTSPRASAANTRESGSGVGENVNRTEARQRERQRRNPIIEINSSRSKTRRRRRLTEELVSTGAGSGSTASSTTPATVDSISRQQQLVMMGAIPLSSTSTTTTASAPNNDIPSSLEPFPQQQLDFAVLDPFPESVFSYTLFLCCSLIVWVLYLLLPRGFRKQYCLANRRRYERRNLQDSKNMPAAGYWLPVRSAVQQQQQQHQARSASRQSSGQMQMSNQQPQKPKSSGIHNGNNNNNNNSHGHDKYKTPPPVAGTPPRASSSLSQQQHQQQQLSRDQRSSGVSGGGGGGGGGGPLVNHPPSPDHPALKKIPPNKILAETMARLQGRGIRLIAHGVHCDPKRVWIRLEDTAEQQQQNDTPGGGSSSSNAPAYVTWQTEFPRRVPNQSGQVSIVLMRGSLHRIALPQVLYVDVGKKTHALQVLPESRVQDTTCFSLLTQNGSLDLQANSKLERDSLVSCFSMILDDVHGDEDWRALYEASPDPSLANSSTAVNGSSVGGGGIGSSGRFVNI